MYKEERGDQVPVGTLRRHEMTWSYDRDRDEIHINGKYSRINKRVLCERCHFITVFRTIKSCNKNHKVIVYLS